MKQYLAEACSNTFVLFDCMDREDLSDFHLEKAHQRLKEENRDDALILVGGSKSEDSFSAKMVVLGLDGALGEYCGNGARACAAYLFKNYGSYKNLFLRTNQYLHRLAHLGKDDFSVTLPRVSFSINPKFILKPQAIGEYTYVEAIEPHLVIEQSMSKDELFSKGRLLAKEKDVFPLGMNLNAYHVIGKNAISVTTYERGVQRLTKSCGTGSISSAAAFLKSQGKLTGAVDVITPGGVLKIIFEENEIILCGEGKYE